MKIKIYKRISRIWMTYLMAGVVMLAIPTPGEADFNGDGYADLAIAVPKEEVSSEFWAGMVMEVDGGILGITAEDRLWHQDAGLAETCEEGDWFGKALAVGDFDADGYTDLVVGVPWEDLDGDDHVGVVHVIYGSTNGLTAVGSQLFDQDNATSTLGNEPDDQFGNALAVGDYNNDGYDDLAVAAVGEDVYDIENAGAVAVLFGSASGLDGSGSQWIVQSDFATGTDEADDHFGFALTAGDFDGDGFSDLAVGTPGEDMGTVVDAGAVFVIRGSASGLVEASGWSLWHQNRSGIPGNNEQGDGFGFTLAAADFNADGFDDLVVGSPKEDIEIGGVIEDAGMVHIIDGSASGLTATGSQYFFQGGFGSNSAETDDHFGTALVAADFDGDGYADLVVGTPGEDWGADEDAGVVQYLPGGPGGLDGASSWLISEAVLNHGASLDPGDRFGNSLAAGDFNNDGLNDLAVGVPGEDLGAVDTGTVYILPGNSTTGLNINNGYLDQCTSGYLGGCDAGDGFGSVLAARPTKPGTETDRIFSDGFEAGNTSAWTVVAQ